LGHASVLVQIEDDAIFMVGGGRTVKEVAVFPAARISVQS